jgi:endoglucanase
MDFSSGGTTTSGSTSTSGTGTRYEAENWSNMSGVQTENTSDAGGGKDVGWIDNGDWMDYNVSVSSAGSYTLNFRVSSIYSGSQFQVKNSSGAVLATVNVPLTGGYQTFQTVSANVNLNAGSQTIRIQSSASLGFNFNWFEVAGGSGTTTSTTPTSSTSTRIEAENWTSMSGVQTENTSDAGGGKDVGWIDNGDWMNYTYNAPASGTFTVSLRIATIYSGSQFQIKNSAGTVLATVNVPITGGFQTWQTITASVNLPAGSQTLRLQSSGSAGYNINWLELSQGSAALSSIQANGSIMTTETTNVATTPALDVYPNPTTDRFVLQVNNSLSGNVSVQVINLAGAVQKQFSFSKAAGSTQFYISIGDLAAATYIVKVTMGTWSDSRQIVKQ